ncbi:MAG: methyltransferase domain-containing protein [Flavobacteriales bacterium]
MRLIRKLAKQLGAYWRDRLKQKRLKNYHFNGNIPWAIGYEDYKFDQINAALSNKDLLVEFSQGTLPPSYGVGLDERIVEIPWLWSRLNAEKGRLLDAGSSLNHQFLIDSRLYESKEIAIYTYYPENTQFLAERISYVFGDLRTMPFKDSWFDEIACISTIEHIDKDNSIYGYQVDDIAKSQTKSYEYLKAIAEMVRILRPGGRILMTFPFGIFEDHGFFQQFDQEMVDRLDTLFSSSGQVKYDYLSYTKSGWQFSEADKCSNAKSFNPHTGIGKGNDGAAHSRAICCIEFTKSGLN